MLPSRSRLQGWNPDSLSPAASAVSAGGASVYGAVRDLQDGCDRLPDAQTWKGKAHDAAADMFGPGTNTASQFASYADAVAAALATGEQEIDAARYWLLKTADEIDQGELHVTDQWVVLIKPAQMSVEKAADLQKQAEAEQEEINRLLLAVGDADDDTAAKVQGAAEGHGFKMPDPHSLGGLLLGQRPPADEVPNPRAPGGIGLTQQELIRNQNMAEIVREKTVDNTSDGQRTTTVTMQDGSKHVFTVEKEDRLDKGPVTSDSYYDTNGKLVSTTSAFQYKRDGDSYKGEGYASGAKVTELQFPDGTYVGMQDYGNGVIESQVITPDGRRGELPPKFFSDPIPTLAGGALTGLEKQAERGIPTLSASALEEIGAGAKYGGPVLGVAVATFHAVTAPTAHEACVAAVSGGAGVAGGIAADALLATLAPEAGPFAAGFANVAGSWTLAYGGSIIGNMACPR